MSNYTITTDFGAKDSLPSSNSAKVVRGSEFTTEFTNIQTAIATKADTAGDTFTGVVNFSADVAVNSNTLFVDVSEAKVGIGTNSPAGKIHSYQGASGQSTVNANANGLVIEDNANNGISILTTSANTGAIFFGDESDNFIGGIEYEHPDNALSFTANNTERMRIDSSGKVGIGTTTPSAVLHVQSSTGSVGFNYGTSTSPERGNLWYDTDGTAWQFNIGKVQSGSFTPQVTVQTSGNVGIGETNPADKLQVTDGAIRIKSTFPRIYFEDTNQNSDYSIMNSDGSFSIYDDTNAVYRMRIDSSGNVGIGTTNPSAKLHVQDSLGSPQIRIDNQGTGSGIASLMFHGGGTGNPTSIIQSGGADSGNVGIIFKHGNNGSETERMRIDSSGNLLVGTTADVTSTNAGVQLRADNTMRIAKTDGAAQSLYRLNSDGNIINFYKDGTSVGSIGTVSGDIRIGGSDDNHAGVRFAASTKAVIPVKNTDGDLSDNTTDLGASNSRFKDIYLSGGVYVGGTTSANKLDDYEEGTWTPTVYANDNTTQLTDGVHYNLKTASYTKIGQLVHLVIKLEDIRSTKDDFNFSVPFTSFDNDLVVGSTLGQDIGSESNTSPIFGRASGRFEIRKDDYQFAYGTCQYRTNS